MSLTTESRTVLDALRDAAIVADCEGTILHVNPACEQLLGHSRAALHGEPLTRLMPSRHHEAHRAGLERYVQTGKTRIMGQPVRVAALHADGTEIEIELSLSALPGGLLLGCVRDLRERVELERQEQLARMLDARSRHELEQQRARLHSLFMQSPTAIAVYRGPEHVIELANPIYRSLTAREVVGQRFRDVFPELVAQGVVTVLDSVYQTGEPFVANEFEVMLEETATHGFFNWVVLPLRDLHGVVDGLLAHSVDVTAHVLARRERESLAAQVAQAVREKEQSLALLDAVVTQMPAGLIVIEPDGKLLFANARVASIWRRPFEAGGSIVRYRHFRAFHPDGRPVKEDEWALARAVIRGETTFDQELQIERGDGTRGTILSSAAPVRSPEGAIIAGVVAFYDVSERKRMEEAMRRQSETTRTITDNATLGLLLLDTRQHCTYMNAAAETILGLKLADSQGRVLHDVVHHTHPDGRPYPREECVIVCALSLEQRQEGEETFVRPNGQFYDVRFTASPIIESGVPVGTVVEFQDVTEQKRARLLRQRSEAEQRFLAHASELLLGSLDYKKTLATVAHLAVPELADWCALDLVTHDDQGVEHYEEVALVHAEPDKVATLRELRRRLGTSPDAGLGKAVRTGQAELIEKLPDALLVARAVDAETLALLRSMQFCSLICAPLKVRGRVIGVLTFASSTPDALFAPADLEFAVELAHRAALAVENARLYQQAQAAIVLRDEFLLIASHELRTPLTPLQLQLQNLERTLDASFLPQRAPERLTATLQRGRRQVERLIALVENLLDVSHLQMGRIVLQLEPLNLTDLIREVVSRFSEDAARKGSPIEVLGSAEVVGHWDRLRLEQVVVNLISNALKYGDAQPISIDLARDEERAVVRVSDHGIGVPIEQLQSIFGRFERAVPARSYGGLGLGLYIVQQIVGAHGGAIRAESTPGSGATFVLELPLMPPAPHPASSELQPREGASPTI